MRPGTRQLERVYYLQKNLDSLKFPTAWDAYRGRIERSGLSLLARRGALAESKFRKNFGNESHGQKVLNTIGNSWELCYSSVFNDIWTSSTKLDKTQMEATFKSVAKSMVAKEGSENERIAAVEKFLQNADLVDAYLKKYQLFIDDLCSETVGIEEEILGEVLSGLGEAHLKGTRSKKYLGSLEGQTYGEELKAKVEARVNRLTKSLQPNIPHVIQPQHVNAILIGKRLEQLINELRSPANQNGYKEKKLELNTIIAGVGGLISSIGGGTLGEVTGAIAAERVVEKLKETLINESAKYNNIEFSVDRFSGLNTTDASRNKGDVSIKIKGGNIDVNIPISVKMTNQENTGDLKGVHSIKLVEGTTWGKVFESWHIQKNSYTAILLGNAVSLHYKEKDVVGDQKLYSKYYAEAKRIVNIRGLYLAFTGVDGALFLSINGKIHPFSEIFREMANSENTIDDWFTFLNAGTPEPDTWQGSDNPTEEDAKNRSAAVIDAMYNYKLDTIKWKDLGKLF